MVAGGGEDGLEAEGAVVAIKAVRLAGGEEDVLYLGRAGE